MKNYAWWQSWWLWVILVGGGLGLGSAWKVWKTYEPTRDVLDVAIAVLVFAGFVSLVLFFWLSLTHDVRRELREQKERLAAEAAEQQEKEEAVLAQMKAEQTESADFHQTLHRQVGPYRLLHFRTMSMGENVMLNGAAKAYWLDGEALKECSINDPVLQTIPVKVVEGQWQEHKVYRPFPNGRGQTFGYSIAEAKFTQRHEFFLAWGKGPWKWDVAAWDSAGVKLKDLFGQTITLPISPDIIREVLSFVTGYDSVAHYALRAIGAKIVAAIVAAPANRELRLARVALMLGTDALGGRVFSEECWQGLAQRDPTKL